MSQHLSPVTSGNRIKILDILRGFAIFGILMVNMQWMNAPVAVSFSSVTLWDGFADQVAEFIIRAFFESKFYVLFSMLFGYGFWLFLHKPSDDFRKVLRVYKWRLTVLVLFGVAHVLLLWPGDILIWYGLLGFLLILFRNTPDPVLIRWAIVLILIPASLTAFFAIAFKIGMMFPESAQEINAAMEEQKSSMALMIGKALDVYANGSFSEILRMRLEEYRIMLPAVFFFYPNVLAMFLVGQYAARKGYLNNIAAHLGLFRSLLKVGLIGGVPAGVLYAFIAMNFSMNEMNFWVVISYLLSGFGGPALTLGYVSAIVLFFHSGVGVRFFSWLAPVGRMALTNYLMHSIIAAFLFHSYGLGLYGQFSTWQNILLTLVIFSLQIPFSNLWLKYFRFGPFEWLWRSVTYFKWQPMVKNNFTDNRAFLSRTEK